MIEEKAGLLELPNFWNNEKLCLTAKSSSPISVSCQVITVIPIGINLNDLTFVVLLCHSNFLILTKYLTFHLKMQFPLKQIIFGCN